MSDLAGALLAFAFSPNDAERYIHAKREAQIIRELPFAAFPESVDPEEERELVRKELIERFGHAQMPYVIHPRLEYKQPLYIYGFADAASNLGDIRRFFTRSTAVNLVDTRTDAKVALEAAIASRAFTCRSGVYESPCHEIPEGSTLFEVRITAPDEVQASVSRGKRYLWFWHKMPRDFKGTMILRFGREDRDPMTATAAIDLSLLTVGRPNEKAALSWLRSLPDPYPTLVGGSDAGPVLFPGMSEVWDEISRDTPDDAIVYLEGKLNAARRSISMLGMSIDERAIAVAGTFDLSPRTPAQSQSSSHAPGCGGFNAVCLALRFVGLALTPRDLRFHPDSSCCRRDLPDRQAEPMGGPEVGDFFGGHGDSRSFRRLGLEMLGLHSPEVGDSEVGQALMHSHE
jgi:hypothetical protein